MAKGKNLNPADAHRKAQRAKELKKNKEKRNKARETATLKKDTSGLETEIQDLEDLGEDKLDQKQIARLKELRAEVTKVRKIKQDYVNEHPDQAHLVRGLHGSRRKQEQQTNAPSGNAPPATRSIFGKNGLPVHPERSVYYDPVMNPYGMPPPGMPYLERPLLPHEIGDQSQGTPDDIDIDSDAEMSDSAEGDEDDDDDDDNIALPAGPPPEGVKDSASDLSSESSDDDIPMPSGPPPPKSAPLPQEPPPAPPFVPGVPYNAPFPPFPPTFPGGFQPGYAPPFAQGTVYPPQMSGFQQGSRPRDRQHLDAVRVVQDPLSNVPHITFQAHQAQQRQAPPPAGLPAKPTNTFHPASSATVSAEPELRDLKKEATAFVPASMRRAVKKGANNSSATLQVDAAPGGSDNTTSAEHRKDLVGVLNSQLGVGIKPNSPPKNSQTGQGKDDYDRFLAEVGSFL